MQADVKKIGKRLLALLVIIGTAIILLGMRVGYWSLYKGQWLQEKAEAQWVQDAVVAPRRGTIYDRNKNIFAQSASSDTVVLRPEKVKDADAVADALSVILELPREDVYAKATDEEKKEIWLKRQISTEQSDQIKEMKLAGVSLITDVKRYYPNNELAAQIVGYTTVDGEGQTGIEKRYDSILEGRQGRMVAETDKQLNEIPGGQEMIIEPVDGQNVVLTIDEVIQNFLDGVCQSLYEDVSPQSVQGIIMDANTGQVLGMSNAPGFDLNDPPRSDGETLTELSRNNVTATSFEPGSLMGAFTMASALSNGSALATYECTGEVVIDGEKILCDHAHGTQTMEQAVLNGCTVAVAQQAAAMSKEEFYAAMSGFGFGQKTGIDFSTDTAGELLSMKYARDADIASIGAGENVKVSQLQVANAVCALVNGGTLYVPQLVLELCDSEGNTTEAYEPVVASQAATEQATGSVQQILAKSSASEKGAAFSVPGYATGAVFSAGQMYEGDTVVSGKEVSTFAAYSTGSATKYVVVITATGVDKGESSDTICGPYAMKVLEEVLRYKNVEPDNAEGMTQKVQVPDVSGMELAQAKSALEEAGLAYVADGTGLVTSQIPAAGEEIYTGATVSLSMDTKPEPASEGSSGEVVVPDFKGLSFEQAKSLAIESGLKFVALGNGTVSGQYPAKDTPVPAGSSITLSFKAATNSS